MRAKTNWQNILWSGAGRHWFQFGMILGGLFSAHAEAAGLKIGDEIPLPNCSGWVAQNQPGLAWDLFAIYLNIHGLPVNPPGGHFRFKAQFPRARYVSWQNYDFSPGNFTSLLTDTELIPDAGSFNPFLPNIAYLPDQVSYTIDILDIPSVSHPAPSGSPPNILYGGYRIDGSSISLNNLIYRIYLQEPFSTPAPQPYSTPLNSDAFVIGDVPLPKLYFVVDDPGKTSKLAIAAMCTWIRWTQDYQRGQIAALTERALARSPAVSAQRRPAPSQNPAAVVYRAIPRPVDGAGRQFNAQIGYLRMFPDSAVEVIVMKFRAPSFPDTGSGQEITGLEQTRYWSVCMQQDSLLLLTTGCLHDSQFKVDGDGFVRLVLSYPENRPLVGGEFYGNWLAVTDTRPEVILRHMLPDLSLFPESLLEYQGDVNDKAQIVAHMGEYFPLFAYCTRQQFESGDLACEPVFPGH